MALLPFELRLLQWSRMRRLYWMGLFCLTGCNRTGVLLLHSSIDLHGQREGTWVQSLRERPRFDQIQGVDQLGRLQRMPVYLVWGYRTSGGDVYRLYEHSWYKVIQRGGLMIYHPKEWFGGSSWDRYYFSMTPSSALHQLTKDNCMQVFSPDSCMLNVLGQMRNWQLITLDSHRSYGLVNAYQYCKNHPRTR